MLIFSGNANPELAKNICKYLKIELGDVSVDRFSEGEIRAKINQNVRGKDVFVVQPTCPPVNENLMELLILLDAFKRASCGRLTAVLPFYGYARQDRKDQPRVPITAKLVANLLTTAGSDRVITMDLHAGQIQGFFDIPVDHLYAAPVLVKYWQNFKKDDLVIATPDVGGVKMARAYAKSLGAGLAIVDKRRIDANSAEVMNVLGEIKNKTVIITDDMIATAGSLTEAALILKEKGAKEIYACASHGIFSGPALARIENSPIKEVIITDSIPLEDHKKHKKINVISVAALLGEAIKRIHEEESVSSLFKGF